MGSFLTLLVKALVFLFSASSTLSAGRLGIPKKRFSHMEYITVSPPKTMHLYRVLWAPGGKQTQQARGSTHLSPLNPFRRDETLLLGHLGTQTLQQTRSLRELPQLSRPGTVPSVQDPSKAELTRVSHVPANDAARRHNSPSAATMTSRNAGSLSSRTTSISQQDTGLGSKDLMAAVNETEMQKQALLAFKRNVTSDPTGALTGWRWFQPSPCSWNGVSCSRPGHVSSLNLTNCQLAGLLDSGPPPLGRLWDMRSLLLSGNSLTGGIPPSLFQASNIEALELRGNSLEGSIPAGISSLQNLTLFDVTSNRLSGSFPSSMGNLTALKMLRAANNRMDGRMPSTLSRLTNLEQVILDNNSISGPLTGLLGRTTGSPLSLLSLSSNKISGWLPWPLGLRTGLTFLDLSRNQLSDSVPAFMGDLQRLKTLNLSSNQLSGTLPSNINMMTTLASLDLSNNQLSGSLPLDLASLTGLTFLNVSFNNLSGVIPSTGPLSNFPESSFVGNPNLCLGNCSPASPPSPNTSQPCPPPGAMEGPPPPPHRLTVTASPPAGMATGTIVAIIVAGIGSVILISTLFTIYVCSVSPSEDDLLIGDVYGSEEGGTSKPSLPSAADFAEEGAVNLLTMFNDSRSVCLSDVLRATDQLGDAKKVGGGGTGGVYRAQLPTGKMLAVKKLSSANLDSTGSPLKFKEQAQVLGSLTHDNVLPLLGFWADRDQHLLLYDWMPRGNLHRFLHSSDDATWQGRFKAALGVAQALKYLHHTCNPPVAHGCLHPGNVLLDSKGEAKVGDVGVARLVYGNSSVQVTPQGVGYAAPELAEGGVVAGAKGDVYSFGVILLEVVSGKTPTDPSFAETGSIDLVGWARGKQADADLEKIFDERLESGGHSEEMLQIVKVALLCVVDDPSARPPMTEVVSMLLRARDTAARIRRNPTLRDLLV